MRFILQPSSHWILVFAVKVLGLVVVVNLIVLAILWILKILHLFTLILVYEALFISSIGVLLILSTYIYRKDSIPSRWGGSPTGWFDYKRFAKLKPEERQRYRQEGKIIIIIGLILLVATIIIHFSIPY